MSQQVNKTEMLKIVKEYLRGGAFKDRKITDTPTDTLQVTPKGYVDAITTYFNTLLDAGTAGQVLTSNGVGNVPTYQNSSGGTSTSTATTFTFNGSGGTSASVTLSYQKIGNWVTLFVPPVTATSGTNSSQFNANTQIDSAYRPVVNQLGLVPVITDNGGAVLQPGLYVMQTNGILSIRKDSAGNNFTDASTCGSADGFSITYYIA